MIVYARNSSAPGRCNSPALRKIYPAEVSHGKAVMSDVGIGGVCPTCNHFLLWSYDGDPRDPHPDPRQFRYRCFTCEPKTKAELKRDTEIEAARPKPIGIIDLMKSKS